MKTILTTLLMMILAFANAQGQSSCSSATQVLVNGIKQSFDVPNNNPATSPACSYIGNALYVKFQANSQGSCVMFDSVLTKDSLPVEFNVYSGFQCNNNQLISQWTVCMPAGHGIWSPSTYVTLVPGQNYYVQITTAADSISFVPKVYTPSNDNCAGATPISAIMEYDQNSCHTAGNEVFPDQLCAFTIENDAFYDFVVSQNGASTVTVSNIYCSNNANSAGIQIGAFTGSCSQLQYVTCSTTNITTQNASFNFTVPNLTAGQHIYIVIDGNSGSRCSYGVTTTNAFPLALGNDNHYVYTREFKLVASDGEFNLVNTRGLKTDIAAYDMSGRLLLRFSTDRSQSFGRSWASGVYIISVNGVAKKFFK